MNVDSYIASGVIEAVVLGVASEQEQREVQCMAKIYPEIQAELTALQEALEGYANAHAQPVPEGLKASVLGAIEGVPQESDESTEEATVDAAPIPMAQAPKSRTGWWSAAAAIALLIAIGGLYMQQQRQLGDLHAQMNALEADAQDCAGAQEELKAQQSTMQEQAAALQAQLAIMSDPATQKITLGGTDNLPDGRAIVFWNTVTQKAYLDASGLPAPEPGKQYQLWAIVDGKPTDMGVFDLATASAAIQEMVDVAEPQAFAITLETEGGNPTPNLAALVVIGNV